MKKFLILVMVAILTTMAAGCMGEVKTYTDSGRTLDIGVDQEFVIALGSELTTLITGYGWQESHDDAMLEMVEKRYKLSGEAEEGVVGAGGVEYFRFKTLNTGKTEITMVYKRPWEEAVLDRKVFAVSIK